MTTNVDVLLAWIAIGLAGSIAGWIWPFRRGVAGIVVNAAVATSGAVSLGLLGRCLGFYAQGLAARSMLFAAMGTIGALLLAHVLWARLAPVPPPNAGTRPTAVGRRDRNA